MAITSEEKLLIEDFLTYTMQEYSLTLSADAVTAGIESNTGIINSIKSQIVSYLDDQITLKTTAIAGLEAKKVAEEAALNSKITLLNSLKTKLTA